MNFGSLHAEYDALAAYEDGQRVAGLQVATMTEVALMTKASAPGVDHGGQQGETGRDGGNHLVQLIDKYVAERTARGEFNGGTPLVVRSVLMTFARHTAHLGLCELSEQDIDSWIADPTLKPGTRNSRVTKLKPFIRWLAARDYVVKDFTLTYRAPKVPKGLPRFLEVDQVSLLVQACGSTRDRLIVMLMIHLGLRRIEVSRIDIEDINFGDRMVDIRGKNGQGRVTRSLPITEEPWAAMMAYLAERPARSGPLVRLTLFDRRVPERTIAIVVADLMREVGIKKFAYDGMSGHALRHSFAQHLIDAGTDIYQVQSAMGHSSIATTEIYRRRKANGLREAMGGRVYATSG